MKTPEMDSIIKEWESLFVRLNIEYSRKSMPISIVYGHFQSVMECDLKLINTMLTSKCVHNNVPDFFKLKLYTKYLKNITAQECEKWAWSIYINSPNSNGGGSLELVEKPENINRFEEARKSLFGDGHEMVI